MMILNNTDFLQIHGHAKNFSMLLSLIQQAKCTHCGLESTCYRKQVMLLFKYAEVGIQILISYLHICSMLYRKHQTLIFNI